jgi:predicted nucleic acid-binding protein
MANGIKTVCIDSCVVISLLKEGKDRIEKGDVPILKGLLADIHSGKIHVIFPTILRTEILECNIGKKLIAEFDLWTALRNFDEVPVNSRVAKTAAKIRSYYSEKNRVNEEVPKLALADCIFIATAIENDCPILYTYDGDRLKPSKQKKLLSLKSPIAEEYPLQIQKPEAFQLGM